MKKFPKNIFILALVFLFPFFKVNAGPLEPLLNYLKTDSDIRYGGTEIFNYDGKTYLISVAGVDVGNKNELKCRKVGEVKAKRDMVAYINEADISSQTNLTISETSIDTLDDTQVTATEEYIEEIKENVLGSINHTTMLGGWYSPDKAIYYMAIYKIAGDIEPTQVIGITSSNDVLLADTGTGKEKSNERINSGRNSDVDSDIPVNNSKNEETFALIIANENYQDVAPVYNAINDGEVFAQYCTKTLGIPERNVHLLKNATLNNMKREINLLSQIADSYDGKAKFIVYYAGHGVPDESNGNSYLLPVDGYISDLSSCYSLSDFYNRIGNFPSEKIVVFLDACFSGSLRGDGMLQAARGVSLKAKSAPPAGKMIVLSAAQGDETAYPYEEEGHGLFTYYILKNLKETKGKIKMGELADKVIDSVTRQSLVINGKKQTPAIQVSSALGSNWKNWTIKD